MTFGRKFWGSILVLTLLVAALLPGHALANANDFSILSFEADYYLTRDESKRSKMRVVERIVAQFPDTNQNHGIERALPKKYSGHNVRLKISTVKSGDGKTIAYTTYGENDNEVLRIGDPDTYVHGTHTYRIEYTLHDVTKQFDDHDELYWDVNGTGWQQTFGSVTARLHLEGVPATAFNERMRCYVGVAASTEQCKGFVTGKDDTTTVIFTAGRTLYSGENMTFVAGFDRGTFMPYEPTWLERYLPVFIITWLALGGVILLIVIGVLVHATRRYGRSPKGRGTIVPEYLPPKGLNVLVAAEVYGKTNHAVTAQLIDLAVRHYLKIYETETRGNWFRKRRTYELELVKATHALTHDERELVYMLFGKDAAVGKRVTIEALRAKLYKQSVALQKGVTKRAEKAGYFADRHTERKRFYLPAGLLIGLGLVLLQPGVFIAGVVMLIVVFSWRPRTEQGVTMRDYLRGLHHYMKLAEADRMRALQGPDGAAKMHVAGIDPRDKKQLVKLYERLLPYAILFGMEKEWVKQFAAMYEEPPEWYAGHWTTFSAVALTSSLNSFTATSDSTFAAASDSSSSGFSGGSSGGGGGGGGGGW